MKRICFIALALFSACGYKEPEYRLSALQESELMEKIETSILENDAESLSGLFYCPTDFCAQELADAAGRFHGEILEWSWDGAEKVSQGLFFYRLTLKYKDAGGETVREAHPALYVRLSERYGENGTPANTVDPYIFVSWDSIPEELRMGAPRPEADAGETLPGVLGGA